MGKDIDTGLCYEFVAQEFPGTQLQVYAAQIQGPDPNYVFKRRFLELWSYKVENGLVCETDLYECGIYEFSIRWLTDVMAVWHWLLGYLRPLRARGDGG